MLISVLKLALPLLMLAPDPRIQSAAAADGQSQKSQVVVTVDHLVAPNGFVLAALFDDRGWDAPPIAQARVKVEGASVLLAFQGVRPGRYAVRLFHDQNGDGKMQTNLMGIPTEPFGFSNNAPAQFGPPSFEAAAFDVGMSGSSVTITLP